MKPLAVVGGLNELPNGGSGVGEITIGAGVDLLVLERLHEALGHGVVIRAAGPAHAGLDPGRFQAGDVVTAADLTLARNLALLRSITSFGETSATILLAELPNIAEFTPKALAAFTGLSPQEHSSGASVRRPGKMSRIGSERLRSALYMCALSAKRTNKALTAFVQRMIAAGKPPKVILVAVARKLLVYAHAVVRTQKPFQPFPDALSSI